MRIPHNKPTINELDEQSIISTLKSGYIAQGNAVEKFESLLSKHVGLDRSVVVSNGTTALYLSLMALEVKKGDEVILPTYVCSALLNAIYMLGAVPVLVDVDYIDFNIDWSKVGLQITNRTKAIIVPHIFGMPSIIPNEYKKNLKIVEDCATAINSYIEGVHAGHQGDCAIYSFYATKYFTSAGAGGCVSSTNSTLINKVCDYREFDCREEYYPRFNFQITDVQAAMGVSQLKRVDSFSMRREIIAKIYRSYFDSVGIDYQRSLNSNISFNNYRFIIKLEQQHRDSLQSFLESRSVSCIIPIDKSELLHNYLKLDQTEYLVAEHIASTTLSLPIYPLLSDEDLSYIIDSLNLFFK